MELDDDAITRTYIEFNDVDFLDFLSEFILQVSSDTSNNDNFFQY